MASFRLASDTAEFNTGGVLQSMLEMADGKQT